MSATAANSSRCRSPDQARTVCRNPIKTAWLRLVATVETPAITEQMPKLPESGASGILLFRASSGPTSLAGNRDGMDFRFFEAHDNKFNNRRLKDEPVETVSARTGWTQLTRTLMTRVSRSSCRSPLPRVSRAATVWSTPYRGLARFTTTAVAATADIRWWNRSNSMTAS